MDIQLRDYQQKMIEDMRKAIKQGHKNIIGVLACGGGKTVVQASIAKFATEKNGTVLFLVHRKEIIDQVKETFENVGVDMSKCECGMVQTLSRKTNAIAKNLPTMLLIDECHHVYSKQYGRILEALKHEAELKGRNFYIIGFTATPIRLKEGGLGRVFDEMIKSVDVQWLIDHYYLAPCKMLMKPLIDFEELKTIRAGEYVASEVNALTERDEVYGGAVENYLAFANGRQTIVYASSIKASKGIVSAYQRAGINAVHLDGETPTNKRNEIIEDFRNGQIKVLSNVDLLGEGFDVPDCECVQLLRPTASLSLHIQQSMRSMRYKPEKVALILDHVGNLLKHGSPMSTREWSLEEKPEKKSKICKQCFAVIPYLAIKCPNCGAIQHLDKQQKKNREKAIQAGMLEAYTAEELENARKVNKIKKYMKTKDYTICESFEDLVLFAEAHQYKYVWVIHKSIELWRDIPAKYGGVAYNLGYRRNASGSWYHG